MIALETLKLSQSAPVELFVLDLTPLSGPVHRFCPQVNERGQSVVWQGVAYVPMPIQARGFAQRASGPFPRPTLTVSNVLGTLGPLIRQFNNLLGGRLIRKRTQAQFLDAVNFAGGNPDADALQQFPDEVWLIDENTGRNRSTVVWTLRNPLDFVGVELPARTVYANHCTWAYRSSDCGYTGGPVATLDDSPTSLMSQDRCSHRLSGCKKRFPNQPLPASFFPGVGQLRQV